VIKVLDSSLPFYKSVHEMDKAGALPDHATSVNKFKYRPRGGNYPSVYVSFSDMKRTITSLFQVKVTKRGKRSKENLTFEFEAEHNGFTYEFKCIPAYFDIKG
jgi:hypothetical protein